MAKAKLHVLYIPGLGDETVAGQRLAVRTWRLWGVESELFQMHWADSEDWDTKLKRLLARVDELNAKNKPVAIVAASAGASAAINIFALRKTQIAGCVLVASKVNHAETIGEKYRRQNPAFVQSAQMCEKALANLNNADRKRIMSRYAAFDALIPRRDSYIAGARNRVLWSAGHAFTIATQILFGAPLFLRFLKALAKKNLLA